MLTNGIAGQWLLESSIISSVPNKLISISSHGADHDKYRLCQVQMKRWIILWGKFFFSPIKKQFSLNFVNFSLFGDLTVGVTSINIILFSLSLIWLWGFWDQNVCIQILICKFIVSKLPTYFYATFPEYLNKCMDSNKLCIYQKLHNQSNQGFNSEIKWKDFSREAKYH